MNLSSDEIQAFNDSLDQCIADPRFMDIFYDLFIGGSEAVAARFADTDMSRQKRALKASLYTAMLAADGNQPAIEHLRNLRDRHLAMRIEPELYDLWRDCLIAAVRACGAITDVHDEVIWRQVLTVAVDLLRTASQTPPKASLPMGDS